MRTYQFNSFILQVQERRLLHDGKLVPLTPKVFDTLVYLVEHHGHLVGKNELMQAVWSDAVVEDGVLPRTIHILRKALGNGDGSKYIETVPTRGYRFLAAVTRLDEVPVSAGVPVASGAPEPEQLVPAKQPRRVLIAALGLVLLFAFAGSGWHFAGRDAYDKWRQRVPPTDSGAAYMKFQSGRFHIERQHAGDYEDALADFNEAIKLDPRFAAAYAGKADAELFLYWESGSHDDIARARSSVYEALELDPNSSYAHVLHCRILATYDWDFAAAERECRRAVDLAPDYHEARRELAFLLNAVGRKEDALKQMDIAIKLAPTSFNKRSRGLLLYFNRRFDEAIAQLKQVEATDPEYSESSRWIARCFEQMHEYDQAFEFLLRFRQSNGAGSDEIAMLRNAYAHGGWTEVLRASVPKSHPKPNMETAGTLAQLGERDAAFQVLAAMVKTRRVMIVHMDSEPRLDPLRADARYEELAHQVGLR